MRPDFREKSFRESKLTTADSVVHAKDCRKTASTLIGKSLIIVYVISRMRGTANGNRLIPVKDDLARLARLHEFERGLEFVDIEMVSDDRVHVESALQHARHLVPGFEHLAAIDALEDKALENHFVPVDGHIAGWDAEDRDLAPVVHRAQHVTEGLRIARHFHADIEALDHAELIHRVVYRVPGYIDGTCRTHLARQIEAIVVDVGDHDVTCASVARDGDGHDADRAGASDQHVLADEVEGQGRVRRVA